MSKVLSDFNNQNRPASTVSDSYYVDASLDFIHPITGNVLVSKDLSAIGNSIMNILTTPLGTRVFYPKFGSNIHGMLFETVTVSNTIFMKQEIKTALEAHEPRIKNLEVDVESDPDSHEYYVSLTFQTSYSKTEEIEFTLKRIR